MKIISDSDTTRRHIIRNTVSLAILITAIGSLIFHAMGQFSIVESELEPRLEIVRNLQAAAALPGNFMQNPEAVLYYTNRVDSLTKLLITKTESKGVFDPENVNQEDAFHIHSIQRSVDGLRNTIAAMAQPVDAATEDDRIKRIEPADLTRFLFADIAHRSCRLASLTRLEIRAARLNLQSALISLSFVCFILAAIAIYTFSSKRKKHILKILAMHESNKNLGRELDDLKSTRDDLDNLVEYYHSIVDAHPEAIAVINTDGLILFGNLRFEGLCNGNCSEITDIVDPSNRKRISNSLKQVLIEGRAETEFSQTREDEKLKFSIKMEKLPETEGIPTGIVAVIRDITVDKNEIQEVRRARYILKSTVLPIIEETFDGRLLELNESAEALLGFKTKDIAGEPTSLFIAPDCIADYSKERKRVLDGGSSEPHESAFITKSGREMHVMLSIFQIRDDNGTVIGTAMAVLRGASKSEQTIELMSTNIFNSIVDFLPGAVTVVQDGNIMSINNSMSRILRTESPESLIGRELLEIIDPDSRIYIEERTRRIQSSWMEDEPVIIKFIRSDGARVWIECSFVRLKSKKGDLICIFCHDLTKRMEMRAALEESERRFRYTFDQSPLATAMVSPDSNLEFLTVNEALCMMTGYSSDELGGMSLIDITCEDDRTSLRENIRILDEGEYDQYSIDIRLVKKDGSLIWTNQTATLVRNSNGGPLYYLPMIHNNTEIREAQMALAESEAHYRSVVDNAGEGILVIADGIIQFANPTISIFTGLSQEELVGCPIKQFIHPDDVSSNLDKHQRRVDGDRNIPVYEFRVIGKDNEILWMEADGVPIEWNGKPAALNFLRDVTERKRTEQALKESEETYTNLFQNAQVSIIRTSLKDGRILECNDQAALMFGYESRDEVIENALIGQMWLNPQERIEMLNQLRDAGSVKGIEAEFQRKDGSIIWARISAKIYPEHGWIEGVLEDITDRRHMEHAILEGEKLLSEVFNSIQDAVYVLDNDRTIIRSNPGTLKLFGLKESPVGHHCCDVLFGDHRECESCSLNAARKTGKLQTSLSRVQTNDGRLIWCEFSNYLMTDEDGKIIGVVEYARDVTEKIRAEKALRESEMQYKTLTENSSDIIIRFDKNSRCTYINRAAARELGMALEVLADRTAEELGLPESITDLIVHPGQYSGELKRERIQFELESDSEPKWFDSMIIPEFDDNSELQSVITIWRDITRLKELQDFASRAERLETAGRIAGQVAHDFNNLLGPMVAYPELIREELPPGHSIVKYVDFMQTAAEQMLDINQELLTLGRRGHYNQNILNLNDIISKVLGQIENKPNTLVVEFLPDPGLMCIKGGGAQIFRAISNLIVNAKDAMNNIGRLTITTQNMQKPNPQGDDFLENSSLPDGEYIRVVISDTGHGIPKKIQSQIFDPFFTTKSSDKKRGSGLGLSVVHSVVEDHHGAINLISDEGRGTTFRIYLPATRETKDSMNKRKLASGSEKILVVDDDEIQREVTKRLLNKLGYTVEVAESGEAAIEKALANHPDLLILDMIMPNGIDGTETYRRILESIPNQRAILMSGFAESDRVQDAMGLGANMFLRKPLKLETISSAIQMALDSPTNRVPVSRAES